MDRNTGRNRKSSVYPVLTGALLGLAMLGFAPMSAEAWGRGGREPSPDRAVARMTEKLELTAEQGEAVRQILEEKFAKRSELREAYLEELETLREETDGKLAEVLSAEQMEELRQLREDRRKYHRRSGRWDDERPSEE